MPGEVGSTASAGSLLRFTTSPRPSARLLALLLTGLAIAIILGTFALSAWSSHRSTIEDARQRLADRSTMLAEHAGRLLDAVQLALAEVGAIPNQRAWDDVAASLGDHLRLKQLSDRLEYVAAFWLTDQTGMPRLTSRAFPAPAIDTSDREHFIRAKDGASGPILSTLLRSRVTGGTNVVMAERLADEKNDFRGIAQAVIEPRYFFDFYAEVAGGGEIMLVRDDGAVVLRHPRLPDAAALSLRLPSVNVAPDYVSPADGVTRIATTAKVAGYPLAVAIGFDRDAVLSPWRRATRLQAIYAAVASLAVLALGAAAFQRANHERSRRLGLEERVRERTAQLQQAVAGRDMLLLELNHRVKNNLQLVTSLLRLQASRIDDPRIEGLVRDFGRRIAAVAEVHGLLQRGEQVGSVEIGPYLQRLCQQLSASFLETQPRAVTVSVDAHSLTLDVDRAITLGLITNELVTNCFKHGLDESGGSVRVALQPIGADRWRLEVVDDGPGPSEAESQGGGIGMRLVDGLARQLGGTMTVERAAGFRVRVDFPIKPVPPKDGQREEAGA
jgi:two-component sensor histidine kinase